MWVGKRLTPWDPRWCEPCRDRGDGDQPAAYAYTGPNGYTWALCGRCCALWRSWDDSALRVEAIYP